MSELQVVAPFVVGSSTETVVDVSVQGPLLVGDAEALYAALGSLLAGLSPAEPAPDSAAA